MDIKLLIVGSETMFRTRLVERLRNEKIDVYALDADGTQDIKKIVKKNDIDVIVIDVADLKRDGLMILASIQRSRSKAEVILINAPDQLPLSIDGMKLGAFNDYLLPLDFELFLSGIRDAADKKKQKDKKTLIQKYQDVMAAVSFAEVGEFGMAKQFLEDAKPKNTKKRQDKNITLK